MQSSNTITKISAALVKAQLEMGNAVKDATNPFFKSKYADLNAIREACLPILNKNGISAIQPTCVIEGVNYVETILLHESGEYISSLTLTITTLKNTAADFLMLGVTRCKAFAISVRKMTMLIRLHQQKRNTHLHNYCHTKISCKGLLITLL